MISEKKCARCNETMDIVFETKDGKTYWYYECVNKQCRNYGKGDIILVREVKEECQ